MKKVAIVIAVEKYLDPDIAPVAFGGRDAERVSAVLTQHGFAEADRVLLIDGQATKAEIEAQISGVVAGLGKADALFFYYAGHLFATAEQNYLACHDSKTKDPVGTCAALAPLIERFQQTNCEQVVLFLDVGGSDGWDESALTDLLEQSPRVVGFIACRADENSYRSPILKHGVWAQHVIAALDGEAPLALARGRLTVASLQKHLAKAVPRTLMVTYAEKKQQTPWTAGTLEKNVALIDMRPILARRKDEADAGNQGQMRQIVFLIQKTTDVKRLSGFKKTFGIPDKVTSSAEAFIAKIAQPEIKEDLDRLYASLKKAFKFARVDMDVSEPGDGTGTIVTPYFNYSIGMSLNPANPSEVMWMRSVDSIKEPAQIGSDAFEEVFGDMFNTLEFSLPSAVNLEAFIDSVEALKNAEVEITYDREVTYCDLQISGMVGAIRLTSRAFSIVHDRPQSPRLLIQSFQQVKSLVDSHHVPPLSFNTKRK